MKPTPWKTGGRGWHVLSFLIVALAAVALYAPFFDNAIVFDDHNIFTSLTVYDYAATPFSLAPRTFPYFTLGFTEVTWKSIEAHRIVSLLIHLLNTLVLFRLLGRWLKEIGGLPADKALLLGFIGSLFFAIHPAAVYGAGYLIQRTILLATLFSLLSLWFYWRSLINNRIADAVTAALFYALAIYSKEHAIMLPAAALLLTALHEAPWRRNLAKAAVFTALCIPPAILVVLAVKGVIGTAYEPDSAKFISALSAIPFADSEAKRWLVSGVTQTGVFFQYLQSWLLPDVRTLSADIRVDFIAGWTPAWIAAKVVTFFTFAAAAALLLRRGGGLGLIGWGMLYTWLFFATELSSLRFQEPFVLYRSYLWAPGIILALMASLATLNRKLLAVGIVAITPVFFLSAQDRLRSLSSEQAVWKDAAAKLPSETVLGADRIFYNRGNEYGKAKKYELAMADFDRVVELNPNEFQGYMGRGAVFMDTQRYPEALEAYGAALSKSPNRGFVGFIQYRRAIALTQLHRPDEALAAFYASADDGYEFANRYLQNKPH